MICSQEGAACVTSLTHPVPPDASLQSQRLTSCLETAMDKLHILALMRASGSEVPTPEALFAGLSLRVSQASPYP
jgi:hypothetical protein